MRYNGNNKPAAGFYEYNHLNNKDSSKQFFSIGDDGQMSQFAKYHRIEPEDFRVDDYAKNFVDSVPIGSTLFFDEESTYPRTKVKLCNCKRCIKQEKANYIVVHEGFSFAPNDRDIVVVLENDEKAFFILKSDFERYFNSDVKALTNQSYDKSAYDLEQTYVGKIISYEFSNSYKKYTDKVYNKPFITDLALDTCLNKQLPSITKEEVESLNDLIMSSDIANHMLGFRMISGFNITEYPNYFRILLNLKTDGRQYLNKATVEVKQMLYTLDIPKSYSRYWHNNVNLQYIGDNYKAITNDTEREYAKYAILNSVVPEMISHYSWDRMKRYGLPEELKDYCC